jgi:hypothetical protein
MKRPVVVPARLAVPVRDAGAACPPEAVADTRVRRPGEKRSLENRLSTLRVLGVSGTLP